MIRMNAHQRLTIDEEQIYIEIALHRLSHINSPNVCSVRFILIGVQNLLAG